MTTKRMLAAPLAAVIMVLSFPALAHEHYEEDSGEQLRLDRFYLRFSVGDGAYINYSCGSHYECETAAAAPLDFEILFGYRLNRFFYLDLAVNWAVVYSNYYGEEDQIYYWAGLRPGVRLVFPLLFHRSVYLRGAVPIQFNVAAHKSAILAGFLFGVGYEFRFGNVGFFGELNIIPYFLKYYDSYFLPIEGRLGVSVRF